LLINHVALSYRELAGILTRPNVVAFSIITFSIVVTTGHDAPFAFLYLLWIDKNARTAQMIEHRAPRAKRASLRSLTSSPSRKICEPELRLALKHMRLFDHAFHADRAANRACV
jgi:hypothetical protein